MRSTSCSRPAAFLARVTESLQYCTTYRASWARERPASVRTNPRWVRVNSRTPRLLSSRLICLITAGGEMYKPLRRLVEAACFYHRQKRVQLRIVHGFPPFFPDLFAISYCIQAPSYCQEKGGISGPQHQTSTRPFWGLRGKPGNTGPPLLPGTALRPPKTVRTPVSPFSGFSGCVSPFLSSFDLQNLRTGFCASCRIAVTD